MLADRILAVIAMSLFIGFGAIVGYFVQEPDLWIVLIVVAVLGIYDFWTDLRPGARR